MCAQTSSSAAERAGRGASWRPLPVLPAPGGTGALQARSAHTRVFDMVGTAPLRSRRCAISPGCGFSRVHRSVLSRFFQVPLQAGCEHPAGKASPPELCGTV